MFGSDKRVLLRHYLEQGMSKAAIARQLGVSRRTVYYWIQKGQLHRGGQEEPVQYGPRGPGRSKLDPYKAIIDARLAEYPKLTATRLYREVRKAGYGGGYGQVKRYVCQARGRGLPRSRSSGSRQLRATRARWTSRTSGCRGESGTRSSWCWATPG